jgi:hypothetical protein
VWNRKLAFCPEFMVIAFFQNFKGAGENKGAKGTFFFKKRIKIKIFCIYFLTLIIPYDLKGLEQLYL